MEILSKKSRYALHGVGYVAAHSRGDLVPFDEVLGYLKAYSGKFTLSASYIAKIFHALSKAGLMVAVTGPRGGYALARPAGSIRLIEIIEALEGPVRIGCCLLSTGRCTVQSQCGVGGLMREAESAFHDFFQKKTVTTLVRQMAFPALDRRTARARPL